MLIHFTLLIIHSIIRIYFWYNKASIVPENSNGGEQGFSGTCYLTEIKTVKDFTYII